MFNLLYTRAGELSIMSVKFIEHFLLNPLDKP
nr:MAG TPA: hypothetical protein [Caudoviricetes sp.]